MLLANKHILQILQDFFGFSPAWIKDSPFRTRIELFCLQAILSVLKAPAGQNSGFRKATCGFYFQLQIMSLIQNASSGVLAKGLKNLLTGGLKPALYQDSSMCTGNNVRA